MFKKDNLKIGLFLILIVIVGFLIYFIFPNNSSIKTNTTGKVITNSTQTKQAPSIIATLTPPKNLRVYQINKISFIADNPVSLDIENKKFELKEDKTTSIIIDDFQGTLNFTPEKIIQLEGTATNIFINGNSFTKDQNSRLKLSSKQSFNHRYLKLSGVYLDSLSYKTSGNLKLGQNKIDINLENETIDIQEFQGDLEIKPNLLKISGQAKQSKVLGSLQINYKN